MKPSHNFISVILGLVYMAPDPQGHDIKLNTFKTSVALKFKIILQNLITANQRKSFASKYDCKCRIRCRNHANPVPCKQGLSFEIDVYIISITGPNYNEYNQNGMNLNANAFQPDLGFGTGDENKC